MVALQNRLTGGLGWGGTMHPLISQGSTSCATGVCGAFAGPFLWPRSQPRHLVEALPQLEERGPEAADFVRGLLHFYFAKEALQSHIKCNDLSMQGWPVNARALLTRGRGGLW